MGGLAQLSQGRGCKQVATEVRGALPSLGVLPRLSLRALHLLGLLPSGLRVGLVIGSTSRRLKDGRREKGKGQDIYHPSPLSARPLAGSGCVSPLKASAPVPSHPVVEATPYPPPPGLRPGAASHCLFVKLSQSPLLTQETVRPNSSRQQALGRKAVSVSEELGTLF